MPTIAPNYQYAGSLSDIAFQNKEISNAMIGSTKDSKNKIIRKQYGYKASEGVSYGGVYDLTPMTHLKALLEGRVYCNLFTPQKYKKGSKLFSSCEKNNDNFAGSSCIGIDVDHSNYSTISEYMKKLTLQPTFFHSSYSHLQLDENGNSKGIRFRMYYVLDENSFIDKNHLLYRYCADCLIKIIEKDTGEKVDDCCKNAAQFFNGTNINNPGLNVEYGCSNIIYNLSDFGITPDGFVSFLENGCEYASLKAEQKEKIIATLEKFTGKDYEWNKTEKKFTVKPVVITSTDPSINASYPVDPTQLPFDAISEQLLKDWDRYDPSAFKKFKDWENRRNSTKYIYRVEPSDWYDDKWSFAPDGYFQLFYYNTKLTDGMKRRKTLYQRICLRRVIDPTITRDQMLVNVLIDLMRFFNNSDNCLNSDVIRELIENAYQISVDDIKNLMAKDIAYLQEKFKPKRGLIFKKAEDYSQETIWKVLDWIYDKNKTVAENLDQINNVYELKIKKSNLYKYINARNIDTNDKAGRKVENEDDEILALIDENLSVRKNQEIIKAKGLKVGVERLLKLIKAKRA